MSYQDNEDVEMQDTAAIQHAFLVMKEKLYSLQHNLKEHVSSPSSSGKGKASGRPSIPTTSEKFKLGSKVVSLHRETFEKILDSAAADLFNAESPKKVKPKPVQRQHVMHVSSKAVKKRVKDSSITTMIKQSIQASSYSTNAIAAKANNTSIPSTDYQERQDNIHHITMPNPIHPHRDEDIDTFINKAIEENEPRNHEHTHNSSASKRNTVLISPEVHNESSLDEEQLSELRDSFTSIRSISRHVLKSLESSHSSDHHNNGNNNSNNRNNDDIVAELRSHGVYLESLTRDGQSRDLSKDLEELLLMPIESLRRHVLSKHDELRSRNLLDFSLDSIHDT